MFESIYIGLTGLTGFSTGINNVSSNIANVNTPGFKSQQLQFADLFYDSRTLGNENGSNSSLALGEGVKAGNTTTVFAQGELRQTGNDQDAAVDGTGFFILRDGASTIYTRAGQFQFDVDGFLVATGKDSRVAGISGGGLTDINITGYRATPPKVTTTVALSGNLSVGDPSHEISDLNVFDALGGNHTLRVVFTNNSATTPGSWLVEVRDSLNALVTNGEIRFAGNGSPLAGFNTLAINYAPPGGVPPLTITLNFGDPGSFSGATGFSAGADSTLQVNSQDGSAAGALTGITFDESGFLVTKYSSGETIRRDQLALATFDFPQGLERAGDNAFVAHADQHVEIGAPGAGEFGRISGGHVELSNVDLSGQFTDLIVIQRGFQASSQVISTSNEMIQQLLDMASKR